MARHIVLGAQIIIDLNELEQWELWEINPN